MTRYYNTSQRIQRIFSVLKQSSITKTVSTVVFVLTILLINSCKKETLKLGDDIFPASDLVSVAAIDTFSIFSYTNYDVASRSDNPSISYLGQLYDPYFGSTSAGFVSQIRLKPAWDGEPFTLDSVKLYLNILSHSGGESDITHTLSLYEIDSHIYTDSIYFSNTTLPLTPFKWTGIAIPKLNDTTLLELRIPNDFGRYLIRDTSKLFYSNTTDDYRSFFKGLVFKMDPSTDPFIMSISLLYNQENYNNYFVLFGHDNADVFKTYYFILDAKNTNAAFNIYSHDFSTATVGDKMVHRNTSYLDSLSYLQSLNGVYTKLTIPGLEKIKNNPAYGNIAVNRARITIPVYYKGPAFEGKFFSKTLPASLVLRYKINDTLKYVVSDYSMASIDNTNTFFDGKLDTTDALHPKYNFNIPSFVQNYLEDATGKIKPELEIFQIAGIKDAIFRANAKKDPIKFSFTYSKF